MARNKKRKIIYENSSDSDSQMVPQKPTISTSSRLKPQVNDEIISLSSTDTEPEPIETCKKILNLKHFPDFFAEQRKTENLKRKQTRRSSKSIATNSSKLCQSQLTKYFPKTSSSSANNYFKTYASSSTLKSKCDDEKSSEIEVISNAAITIDDDDNEDSSYESGNLPVSSSSKSLSTTIRTNVRKNSNVNNKTIVSTADELQNNQIICDNRIANMDQINAISSSSIGSATNKVSSKSSGSGSTTNKITIKDINETQATQMKTITNLINHTKNGKITICPAYKVINDTTFAVDAFRYGEIDGITDYFLTHFHADHYIGLKKSFNKPLYCSVVTAKLVKTFLKVDNKYIHQINVNESFVLHGVTIFTLEANHCPGAVMFLFKLPNNKCILHTGDFRANAPMEEYPEFWNHDISTIYLDTTYLSNKYDFISQTESIDKAKEICSLFVQKHIGQKYLLVCGTYTVGKEKIWLSIAQGLNLKVWLEPVRRKAIECYLDPIYTKYIVDQPEDANIHVVHMGIIRYKELVEYLNKYSDYFDVLLGIRPSGWEKNSKPSYSSKISIAGIEYSEHSSYSELERFIRFLKPKEIISTVTQNVKIPNHWTNYELKPMHKAFQPTIHQYMNNNNKSEFNNKNREDNETLTVSDFLS